MRIAVLNPNMDFLSGDRTLHRYAEVFIRFFAERIVSYNDAKYYDGDAIICFNGRPDLPQNYPPKEFKGLKLVHLMDHVFQTEKTLANLKENNIQYVMAYNRHDKYDDFFKNAYREYIDKVIPVPFGFNELRFSSQTDFNVRRNKVIGVGSVNPVRDPLCIEDIKTYSEFYAKESFTHKWRKALVDARFSLVNEMDSLFPVFPETKKFDYDIVQTYNDYKMFTTCESIMNYPSVKVFEGMACGGVFVGNDSDCYKAIGLQNKVNCLFHIPNDIEDFRRVVKWGQEHPAELAVIAENGRKFVEYNYSPYKIAEGLEKQLKILLLTEL